MSIAFPLLVVFKVRSNFVLAQLICFSKNTYFNSHFIFYLNPHKDSWSGFFYISPTVSQKRKQYQCFLTHFSIVALTVKLLCKPRLFQQLNKHKIGMNFRKTTCGGRDIGLFLQYLYKTSFSQETLTSLLQTIGFVSCCSITSKFPETSPKTALVNQSF